MTDSMIIATLVECAVGGFIIWGLFNEDKLVDFEDRLVRYVKESVHKRQVKRNVTMHREEA